jgi:CheY-like chemotaxis protein
MISEVYPAGESCVAAPVHAAAFLRILRGSHRRGFKFRLRRADYFRMEPHSEEPRAILVLEDDAAVRGVFARVLRQHGFTPVLAGSVDEAITAASAHALSAVTVDLSLGRGPTGLDFLSWLRQSPSHRTTPAVILTGSPVLPPGAADRAHDLGARIFFKPQPYSVLLEHLATEVSARALPESAVVRGGMQQSASPHSIS